MTTTVPPYLGSVEWYRAWLRRRLGADTPLPRQGAYNRALIRGAGGEQTLSVPIEGGRRRLHLFPGRDLPLSEHDDWRHKHLQALASAYGALPYYPYIIHDFAATVLSAPTLGFLCRDLHRALLKASQLEALADWLAARPGYTPRRDDCLVPPGISAFELLCRRGPEMIFCLL